MNKKKKILETSQRERVIRDISSFLQNLRADFQVKILKQYFDFSPFRKRYLELERRFQRQW
ncbi:MAG: hypothetical protein JRI36_12460 [Deltaproteobacteria bacterium]|nr:hypothetical protein [Deltaproteobacteria bacterium]